MSDILKNFIVFEGLDGAGTTTQCKLLYENLKKLGKDVILDAEPTPSPIGKLIRNEYLSKKNSTTPWALALLYAADRENHVNNSKTGLKALIDNGKTIIADRYFYSSLAYQGVNLPDEKLRLINDFEDPEIVIYIDTPVDECLRRIDKRGEKKELFEKKDYLEKTRQGFERAFEHISKDVKFLRIDGNLDAKTISDMILKFVL